MSDIGLVLVIAALALGAGLGAAIKTFPAVPEARAGDLVFWVSRLVAAAAVAIIALDLYTVVKHQTSDAADALGDEVAAQTLAQDLTATLFDGGVLAALAAGLALMGAWLLRPDEGDG
jgi:hypothetical protein